MWVIEGARLLKFGSLGLWEGCSPWALQGLRLEEFKILGFTALPKLRGVYVSGV